MADPVSVTTSLVELVGFAFRGSKSLYQAIKVSNSSKRVVRELLEEVESLNEVLETLSRMAIEYDTQLKSLKLPLLRCGKICAEFEVIISRSTRDSDGRKTSFRDWAKLQYRGGDIGDLRTTLSGYKSTINIAMGGATFRQAAVTENVLDGYRKMVDEATSDPQDQSQLIDGRMESIIQISAPLSTLRSPEVEEMVEEKKSIAQCLEICTQVSDLIETYQTHRKIYQKPSDPKSHEHSIFSTETATNNLLVGFRRKLSRNAKELQDRLQELENRLQDFSKKSRDQQDTDLVQALKEERDSITQCLEIYADASDLTAAVGNEADQIPYLHHNIKPEVATRTIVDTNVKSAHSFHGLNTEHDSGYASASYHGTQISSSNSGNQHSMESSCADRPSEIQSIASDNDDIGSLASEKITLEVRTGHILIRVFLAEEPRFRALCQNALSQMNRQRFVENMRRLLKSFHKSLRVEARNETEMAVARLLRSRRGRLHISQELASHIQQEQEEVYDGDKVDTQIPAERKKLVETWLARASEGPPAQEYEHQTSETDISNSDSENSSSEFPYISELRGFLGDSRSFQVLLRDFMTMFLPIELKHVLYSIPDEHIWVSQEQDYSILNKLKSWVEDNTVVRWNWWPLQPRKRLLHDGESRISWKCTCGAMRWEEISTEQHVLIADILALPQDKHSLQWCRREGIRVLFQNLFDLIFRSVSPGQSATSPSLAAQKYTPSGSSATISSTKVISSLAGTGESSTANHTQRLQQQAHSDTHRQDNDIALHAVRRTQSWILFGIQGAGHALTPAQIPIDDQSTDNSFFRELKRCYRMYRGPLRLWFSVWRIEYCEVVKFSRLTLKRIVRDYKDLPSQQDYLYAPRVGTAEARNPPISPHLFEALFYTCHLPCTWPISHDCVPPPTGDTCLQRIPKRTRNFDEHGDSPIWGLEAVFAVSFARVFVYHCVMIAAPLAFFAWWLTSHPNDLQNATVPSTIALGALSLFWSGAGILTSRSSD